MSKGLFITLEGGEGSGKTTAINGIQAFFEDKGYTVIVTREPGGIGVSEKLRDIVLNEEMDVLTEAYIFAAARREHLIHKVLPAIEQGMVVICDRFVHSSYVYQGIVGGIPLETVKKINEIVIEGIKPDMTLLLDISPELGLERIRSNQRETNKLDNYPIAFHNRVRAGYLSLLSEDLSMVLIDGSTNKEDVLKQIKFYLETMTNQNGE